MMCEGAERGGSGWGRCYLCIAVRNFCFTFFNLSRLFYFGNIKRYIIYRYGIYYFVLTYYILQKR